MIGTSIIHQICSVQSDLQLISKLEALSDNLSLSPRNGDDPQHSQVTMVANVPVFTLANGVAKGNVVKMPGIGIRYICCMVLHSRLNWTRLTLLCSCWIGTPGGAERVEVMVKMALKVCPVVLMAVVRAHSNGMHRNRTVTDTSTRYIRQVYSV